MGTHGAFAALRCERIANGFGLHDGLMSADAAMSTPAAVSLVGKAGTHGTHQLYQPVPRGHHPLLWHRLRHGAGHGLVTGGTDGYRHLLGTDSLLPRVDEVV